MINGSHFNWHILTSHWYQFMVDRMVSVHGGQNRSLILGQIDHIFTDWKLNRD